MFVVLLKWTDKMIDVFVVCVGVPSLCSVIALSCLSFEVGGRKLELTR